MNRGIRMNHPLMGTAMVAPYHKSSQPSAQSAPKPAGKPSLSAEQKAKLEEMKAAYVISQHKASLEAQSGSPGTPTKNKEPRHPHGTPAQGDS